MKKEPLLSLWFVASLCLSGRAAVPQVVSLGACTGSLRAPARVAVDSAGTILVADPDAGQVVMFDMWCRPTAIRNHLSRPLGLGVDSQGRIYVAEEAKGCVSVFDPQWHLLFKLGSGDGEFRLPNYLAVAERPSGTVVYVSDSEANQIKAYNDLGASFAFGTLGAGNGQFDFPAGLCVNGAGELYVVDQNNDRVQVFDPSGGFLRAFSLGNGASGTPSGRAQGAWLDPAGRLYVADTFQGLVKVFDAASGAFLSTVGGFGQSLGQLGSPAGLVFDGLNRLLVTSAGNGRLELYGIDSFLQIAAQPAAERIAAGASFALAVVVGGGPATFQWLKDGVTLVGATNSTFTVPAVQLGQTGGYSVMVTGSAGTWTSSVAQIQVLAPPVIVQSPQNQTVLQGSNTLLEVVATGSALTFQWQLNGLNLEGQTNRTLLLPEAQVFNAGIYSVLVGNPVGSVLSTPAVLTVLVPPTVMEIVSALMAGDGFHLLLNADPGFQYSLEASTDLLHWEPVAGLLLDAGLAEFIDAGSSNFWNRFYRLRWTP